MTEDPQRLFNRRSSTREFLLSKTETEKKEDRFGKISPSLLEDLTHVFPELLFGPSFLGQALKKLENTESFGAIAIQMDHKNVPEEGEDPEPDRMAARGDILKRIQTVCEEKNGIHGLIGDDLFALFLPEIGEEACLAVATKLQSGLEKGDTGTITIGIGSYPTLAYPKKQILDNALKAIDHAVFFGPNSRVVFDSVSLNISGDILYQAGDVDGAIEEYLIALELDSSNGNVHNSLGVCYGVKGAYDKAMESFQAAAGLDAKEVMATYNAGLAQALMGNPDNALKYFQEARGIGPDVFEVAFQMGKCHFDSARYRQARQSLEDAVKIKPDSAPAWSCLGECYAALEMADPAIQAYETAIKKNPNDATALSGLGYLYDLQNRNTEIATLFCKQSVDLSPEEGRFHHRLGRLYLKQNLLEEAEEAFKLAGEKGYDSAADIEGIKLKSERIPRSSASATLQSRDSKLG